MLRKILRKFQPNFQHYVKKIEAQAKKWFSYKKRVSQKKTWLLSETKNNFDTKLKKLKNKA